MTNAENKTINENAKSGFFKRYFPLWAVVLFALGVFFGIVYIISVFNTSFADFVNGTAGAFFRRILSYVTYIFPFSVAELIILMSPILLAVFFIYLFRIPQEEKDKPKRILITLLACCIFLYSTYAVMFSVSYRATPVEEKLSLSAEKVSAEQLYDTGKILLAELDVLSKKVMVTEDGFSKMPYSYNEMNDRLNEAYKKLNGKYPSLCQKLTSKTKPVIFSEALTYLHIGGIYTFFTGESNINVHLPEFNVPYTAAHEMAHQRGIAAEDEANFVGFLVCDLSDDAYIRYSGYLSLYMYVGNALYDADAELYNSLVNEYMNVKIKNELIAYGKFFSKYEKSKASEISSAINDLSLQSQGVPEGEKSYGLVVDLAVAYFLGENNTK